MYYAGFPRYFLPSLERIITYEKVTLPVYKLLVFKQKGIIVHVCLHVNREKKGKLWC